jgi:hypothetical protein
MKTKDEVIAALIAHVIAECSRIDTDARYDAMLDDCYSLASVGGPFSHMSASSVLKECDPTAYRCGKNDWKDGEGFVEIDGDDYDGDEVEKAREEYLQTLISEKEALESDLEEVEAAEEHDDEAADIQKEISEKEQEIAIVERYTF